MAFVSVRESAHLKATVVLLKSVPREVNVAIRAETRSAGLPIWQDELRARTASVQQTRILVDTARITASGQSISLTSAGSRRKALSGGATPIGTGKAWEFGSNYGHGLPAPRRGGYVIYQALAEVAPRIISLWVQTTMRIVHEAFEGKR